MVWAGQTCSCVGIGRPATSLLPPLVTWHFEKGPAAFALCTAAGQSGAIVGGALLGIWSGFKRQHSNLLLATFVFGTASVIQGVTPADQFSLFLWMSAVASFAVAIYFAPLHDPGVGPARLAGPGVFHTDEPSLARESSRSLGDRAPGRAHRHSDAFPVAGCCERDAFRPVGCFSQCEVNRRRTPGRCAGPRSAFLSNSNSQPFRACPTSRPADSQSRPVRPAGWPCQRTRRSRGASLATWIG